MHSKQDTWLYFYRFRWIPWLAVLLAGGLFAWGVQKLPELPPEPKATERPVEPMATPPLPLLAATLFKPAEAGPVKIAERAGDRFRLVGTYAYNFSGKEVGQAIVEDTKEKKQIRVKKGDKLAGDRLEVLEIHPDRVIVRSERGREQLTRRYLAGRKQSGEPGDEPKAVETRQHYFDRPGIVVNRFGKMVEENRWVMERDALMDYHRTILGRPLQLIKLFGSFYGARDENNQMKGYKLTMKGEQEFLTGMGLKNGDIITHVNAMKMTSQRRAEFFIKEFANNKLNTFVLDVERDGKTVQMVYFVR